MNTIIEKTENNTFTKAEYVEFVLQGSGWFHVFIEHTDEDGDKLIEIHELYGRTGLGWTQNLTSASFWSLDALKSVTKELHFMAIDELVYTEEELYELNRVHKCVTIEDISVYLTSNFQSAREMTENRIRLHNKFDGKKLHEYVRDEEED